MAGRCQSHVAFPPRNWQARPLEGCGIALSALRETIVAFDARDYSEGLALGMAIAKDRHLVGRVA